MPAIASLEDLKIAQRDFRSMFLVVSPYDFPFTPHSLRYAVLYLSSKAETAASEDAQCATCPP